MPFISGTCPGALPSFLAEMRMSRGADLGVYEAMSAFGEYILEVLSANAKSELALVCETIEGLLTFGDQEVREATVVGLLEGVTNRCINNRLTNEMARFIDSLGPNGQRACRDLDEFWGVR